MELAQERDRWRTLVGTVKNFRVHKNVGNFLTSCKDWLASFFYYSFIYTLGLI
jgi:hypothetical protein